MPAPTLSLLHWGILNPSGPSHLAAVRFATPVHPLAIRIYPSGASLFANAPDIIAATDPRAFRLRLFFNAQSLVPKAKTSNALAETCIAYTGGLREYPIDWDSQYITRLMIIQAECVSVTIAVYGTVSSDAMDSNAAPTASEIAMPTLDPIQLHPSLHPAFSLDPTRLACQLLSISSRPVSLPLALRLMYCIKPRKEDWDNPGFPLFLNLQDRPNSLSDVASMLSYPIDESCAREEVCDFADRVGSIIESQKSPENVTLISECLSLLACHSPEFVTQVAGKLNLADLWTDDTSYDEYCIKGLCDAATHPDLAQVVQGSLLAGSLPDTTLAPSVHPTGANKPRARVAGNSSFERILANRVAADEDCIVWLRDICIAERSLGIWLLSMIEHSTRVVSLGECAILDTEVRPFHFPWGAASSKISRRSLEFDDMIAFIRALIGVASVLAVFAWSDSINDRASTTRCLAIIRAWQHSEEYRGLVESVLSLTQFMVRLERVLEGGQPLSQAIVFTEQILADLVRDSASLDNADITYTIRAMPHSLLSIPFEQQATMVSLATLVDGGLESALSILSGSEGPFLEISQLDELIVALWIVQRHLLSGVADVFQHSGQVIPTLAESIIQLSDDVCLINATTRSVEPFLAKVFEFFKSALDVLLLFSLPVLVSSDAARLADAVLSVFVCLRSPEVRANLTSVTGSELEEKGVQVLQRLPPQFAPSSDTQRNILYTLLEIQSRHHSGAVQDPVTELDCRVEIIARLLRTWVSDSDLDRTISSLTSLSPSIEKFWYTLPSHRKIELGKLFYALDSDRAGLLGWLLQGELELAMDYLIFRRELRDQDDGFRDMLLSAVDEALKTACALVNLLEVTDAELNSRLTQCLSLLSQERVSSRPAGLLAGALSKRGGDRSVAADVLVLSAISNPDLIEPATRCLLPLEEATPFLLAILSILYQEAANSQELAPDLGEALSRSLRWVVSRDGELEGLDRKEVNLLLERCRGLSEEERASIIALAARGKKPIDQSTVQKKRGYHVPPITAVSIRQLEDVLRQQPAQPSTPPNSAFGHSQETIMLATVSPNSSMLRSPLTTLAKTYTGDSFRQLRNESLRQNMSRLPSLHVDTFRMDQGSPPLRSGHQRSISNSSATSVISIAMLPASQLTAMEDPMHSEYPS